MAPLPILGSPPFGLIVMAMIYTVGDISGAHLNPAVTIAFTLAKKFDPRQVAPYIVSQLLGALLASSTLRLLFGSDTTLGATLPSGTPLQSFFLEFILTFFLMFVIIHAATGSKEQGMFAGISIGGAVFLEALVFGRVCGASMNPARSIGPAQISGHTEFLWIYILAPILGAALAIPIYQLLHSKKSFL